MLFFRKIIIILLTAAAYLGLLYVLFVDHAVLASVLFLFALFLLFHFFLLEVQNKFARWRYAVVFASFGALLRVFGRWQNVFMLLAFVFLHLALVSLVATCSDEVANKRKFSVWSLSLAGGYVFTLWTTLLYAALFLGLYSTFPLSCDQLYHAIDTISFKQVRDQFGTAPASQDTWTTVKKTILQTRSRSIGDVLGVESGKSKVESGIVSGLENGNIGTFTDGNIGGLFGSGIDSLVENVTDSDFSGALTVLNSGADSLVIAITDRQIGNIDSQLSGILPSGGLLGYVEGFKQRWIDQVMDDNRIVNQNMCATMVAEIQKRFTQPAFQVSSLVLMFFVLSPFLRIFIYILQLILFVLLQLLFVCRIYRLVRMSGEVEDVR